MKRRSLLAALAAAALGCAGSPAVPPGPAVLVVGGRIHGRPDADALLLRGGRVAAVGRAAALAAAASEAVPLDAAGGLVVPGFHDAHLHLLDGGLSLGQAELGAAKTEAEAVALAARWALDHPDAGAVRGRGWSYDIVPAGSYPTRASLDAAFPIRPVVLESYDGHAYWFNTAALRRAGLALDARDADEARFVRGEDGRTIQGTVLEAGSELVENLAGPLSPAEKAEGVRRGLTLLAASGVTAADVMSADLNEFEVLSELEARGELPIRVFYCPPLDGDLSLYKRLRARARGRLEFGWLKGFVDGAFESKTAAVLDPYPDGARGAFSIEPTRLDALVRAAQAGGFAAALHAVGDGGVRAALDAFKASADLPKPARRHRVEHAEVVHRDDLARFNTLDVVASMQPLHADPGGVAPSEGAWSRNVGPERLPWSFPWKGLLGAGAVLAFGSDWPVVTQDPLAGLAFAQARKDGALSHDEAVRAYTVGPAYAARLEGELGCLDPGCLADLLVIPTGAKAPSHVLVDGRDARR